MHIHSGIKNTAVILFFFCAVSAVHANGLSITNVALTNVNSGVADIQFDLSWSNSWNAVVPEVGSTNQSWDAVWVFAKFRVSGGPWKHALLSPTGHTATGGSLIEVGANPGGTNVGAFVRRAEINTWGTQTCPSMRLNWNYALNGLAGTNAVDISVLGIEMVYCCTGTFALGSDTDSGTFFEAPSSNLRYRVQSEGAILYGTTAGYLCHQNIIQYGDLAGPIPDAFPKGYRAFYCMKYEISQGQYTDFLQLLDAGLALTNFPNKAGSSRHTIGWNGSTYTNGVLDRACNFLTWANIRTYLDWAGLRPMTELEFEKICRGSLTAVAGEFAWGDAAFVKATSYLGTDGGGSETVSPTHANIFAENGVGPARVGIFATTTSTRREAGAAYCGAMEMSGNLWEIVVTPCHATGRLFTGVHGDGDPYTEPTNWPTVSLAGLGARGGAHDGLGSSLFRCHTSDRWLIRDPGYYITPTPAIGGYSAGGRGVRTAP